MYIEVCTNQMLIYNVMYINVILILFEKCGWQVGADKNILRFTWDS